MGSSPSPPTIFHALPEISSTYLWQKKDIQSLSIKKVTSENISYSVNSGEIYNQLTKNTDLKDLIISITDENGADRSDEIAQFIETFRLKSIAPERVSQLLMIQLCGEFLSRRINPYKVIREINALEGFGQPSQLKAPVQNKHPPLKRLWHKHYLDASISSMARNLQKAMHRYSISCLDQMVADAAASNEERYFTETDVKGIVYDAVVGNYVRLAKDAEIAGEWLLFAKYEKQNYYLAIATHDKSTHEHVRRQIDVLCCLEFSFLKELLENT